MNRTKKASLFITLLIALSSCSFLQEDEEVLYLKTGNSYLPIYTRGNPDAENYIIWTHGGPGSSGLYYGDIDEIKPLHRDYRIVYWDQMSSGGSTGDPEKGDYNLEEFSSHLDGVIKVVQNRYHPDNIFLLGHSWGGFLSSYYLIAGGDSALSQSRQEQLNGLILLNPILDIEQSLKRGIRYIRDEYAPSRIEANDDPEKWNKVIRWYGSHLKNGILYGKDVATHYQYIEDAGGMLVNRKRNDELTKKLGLKMLFFSPFQFYDYYGNQNRIRSYMDIADKSLAREGEPNLSMITLPTLMMAGENDKIAFSDLSRTWFDLLGSHRDTAADREEFFKLYNNCAHAAFLDVKDEFLEDATSFISTWQ